MALWEEPFISLPRRRFETTAGKREAKEVKEALLDNDQGQSAPPAFKG